MPQWPVDSLGSLPQVDIINHDLNNMDLIKFLSKIGKGNIHNYSYCLSLIFTLV